MTFEVNLHRVKLIQHASIGHLVQRLLSKHTDKDTHRTDFSTTE